jgi:putative ABC transport system substrate-binding protein
MRRREFITLIGVATAAWPLAVRAEPSRRVGLLFLVSQQAAATLELVKAIIQGLKEHGWIEGQNITLEYRFANGKQDALPKLAAELVQLRVDAIVTDSTPAMQAAKNATQTVPIVGITNNPVASGFVSSLGRPGGNVTGISLVAADLAGRRLQLLSEMVPGLARVAVLLNPANASHLAVLQQTQAAAPSLKIELHVAEARAPDVLESAFAAISAAQTGALIVLPDGMFFGEYPRVVAFAATERLPVLFPEKQVSRPAALWPTARISRPLSGGWPLTSTRFSTAPIQPSYQSSNRRSSISRSTSRPPGRLASACRTNSCLPPTR